MKKKRRKNVPAVFLCLVRSLGRLEINSWMEHCGTWNTEHGKEEEERKRPAHLSIKGLHVSRLPSSSPVSKERRKEMVMSGASCGTNFFQLFSADCFFLSFSSFEKPSPMSICIHALSSITVINSFADPLFLFADPN